MARNPDVTTLDVHRIIKRVYDEANDSVRVEVGFNSGVSISLSGIEDSITVYNRSISQKVSLTSASTGVVLAALDISGMSTFDLHVKTTSTLVGPQVIVLEVSPHESDDIWIATSLTVTPSLTNGAIVSGTQISSVNAKRARLSTTAITSGGCDVYLIGKN